MVPWLPPGEAAAEALHYGCYRPASMAPPFEGVAEDRTASASKSHSEAEKRRRDRINAQLSTLRKLIPMSEKMDKAFLLEHAVNHIKELGGRAKEASKSSTIPTEIDEVIIDRLNAEESPSHDNQIIHMKGSICCDDRPGFFSELKNALDGLGVAIVEAEITSLGGRVKTKFIVCGKEQNCCAKSLRLALSRIVVSSVSSSYSARSKRQRFFYQ